MPFFPYTAGTTIQTSAGAVTIQGDPMGGGEGWGFKAQLNGRTVFYKQFGDYPNPETKGFKDQQAVAIHRFKRSKWLVDKWVSTKKKWQADPDRRDLIPCLNLPFAYATNQTQPGYVCEWIDGLLPVEEDTGLAAQAGWLHLPPSYPECVAFVSQLTDLIWVLHQELGIAHGDINSANVNVLGRGNDMKVVLIDFGNYNVIDPTLNVPHPLMSNHEYYVAPWLKQVNGGYADTHADCYSWGILAYECLLQRRIQAGIPHGELEEAKAKGIRKDFDQCGEGFPSKILPPELKNTIDACLNGRRNMQCGIEQLKQAVDRATAGLLCCNQCHQFYFWANGQQGCPHCGHPCPPALVTTLGMAGTRSVPLHHTIVLGRDQWPGNPNYISKRHLEIRPETYGRASLYLHGRNQMAIQRSTGQTGYLAPGESCLVTAGDMLGVLDPATRKVIPESVVCFMGAGC